MFKQLLLLINIWILILRYENDLDFAETFFDNSKHLGMNND